MYFPVTVLYVVVSGMPYHVSLEQAVHQQQINLRPQGQWVLDQLVLDQLVPGL